MIQPPAWLGQRPLAKRPDGFGVIKPTPPILRDRRFATVDLLPPPGDDRFHSSVQTAPADVLRRSTWKAACPVASADLSYLTVTFWGFDDMPHTGELLVNSSVATDVIQVFRKLYQTRFPIEQMRVTTNRDLHAPPTGDGNNTTSFECRPVTGSTSWSQHAYGLAIDVDPFQNPYARDDIVVPERASAYTDRAWRRPGMIYPGDVVTDSFAAIGWGWGGNWHSLKDWMHFSQNGR
ncbi:MAG: M15 family metallopeptidase [Actinomycetota bacterium]|nr:M15 family metallopeptidase [Actinomycetota bacterium]